MNMEEPYVCCDICNRVFAADDETTGGFVLISQGVGPCCTAGLYRELRETEELDAIRDFCPEGMSFRAWILSRR